MTTPLPKTFRDRYGPLVDDPDTFFDACQREPLRSFRVNGLKTTRNNIIDRFAKHGLYIHQAPWYPDAFWFEKWPDGPTVEQFAGLIQMQELASMLPPLTIQDELSTAKRVLDTCAAPGSKTTQMAAMMNNQQLIVANDKNFRRIAALRFNLDKAGVINTVVTNEDLRLFPSSEFDIVLLDAPCSAEGTVRKNPTLLNRWSLRRIHSCGTTQRQLILSAFDLLSPNGVLVYSTCTFAPEENEGVLDYLLANRNAKIETIDLPGLKYSPGLSSFQDSQYNRSIRRVIRVWPHQNATAGFFIAKVRKL